MANNNIDQHIVDEWSHAAAGWRRWEAHIAAFVGPLTPRMLDAAAICPGQRVLDVGCGIGDPALAVAARIGPTGHVLAIDPTAPMMETARERATAMHLMNIEFRVARIEDVRAADGPFDAVVGRFSFIFAREPVDALRRARALLKPGGRIAVTAWVPAEQSPSVQAINTALRRQTEIPAVDPYAPGRFQLSEPGELAAALRDAGFGAVQVEPVALYQFARDGDEFWRMNIEMGSALSRAVARLTDAQRAEMRAEVVAFADEFVRGGVLRIPATAQLGHATA